jgi:hypothetical protein
MANATFANWHHPGANPFGNQPHELWNYLVHDGPLLAQPTIPISKYLLTT